MAKVENDLDILRCWTCKYKRQENELVAIMKKLNSAEWNLL